MEAVARKAIEAPGDLPEQEKPAEDIGRRYLGGTMDAMIVFNDPATQCQRSLKINRYIYSTDSPDEVNRIADETQDTLERQFIRHDLKRMEREREAHIKNIEQHRDNLKALSLRRANKGQPGVKHLTSQEIQLIDNGDQTMVKAKEILDEMDGKITAAKLKCGLA